MIRRALLFAVAASMVAACSNAGSVPSAGAAVAEVRVTHARAGLAIPPRLQWMGNFGYCGETSLISAGLYYGQYVSQYEARAIASDGTPQFRRTSQLLLGVNDTRAAAKMHLRAIEWNAASGQTTGAFFAWIKSNVELGYPVVIGIYTNEFRFYGKTAPHAGDPTYDHIVPVTGASESELTFSDNGLWSPTGSPRYSFRYPFASFPATRSGANAKNGPIYSIDNRRNYGVAIAGVADLHHDTMPVRISTSVNDELPPIQNGSNVRPAAKPLILTVTVSDLQPGVSYRLYRYDRLAAVPNASFNANAGRASERRTIRIASGSTYSFSERIMSDRVAVYRAVRSTAP